MDGGRDEDDAAACAGGRGGFAVRVVGVCGGDELREGGFERVVGAEDVDVHDRFEGVGAELGYGGQEIACCSGAGSCSIKSLYKSHSW